MPNMDFPRPLGAAPGAFAVPRYVCAGCGAVSEATTSYDITDTDAPRSGDWAICLHCGHVTSYNADLSRRELSAGELVEALANPSVLTALRVVALRKEMHAAHRRAARLDGDN